MIYNGKDGFIRMGVTLLFMAVVGGIAMYVNNNWPDYRLFGRFPLWQCFLFLVSIWLLWDILKLIFCLCLYIIGFIFKITGLKSVDNYLKKISDKILSS